jgi:predicted MFS family arabinose efflux permease
VAPPTLLLLAAAFGWSGAFIGAGLVGFAVAAALVFYRDPPARRDEAARRATAVAAEGSRSGWDLLLSLPILQNFTFFMLLTVINGGMTTYLIVALGALHGTPTVTANLALSISLGVNGAAVLLGGRLASHTSRHSLVAVVTLIGTASMMLLVAFYNLPPLALIGAVSVAGFCIGLMMPSRDMIVRSVTPPGHFGKVFGFVTTGFNVGGTFSPMIFGALLDYGRPAAVFLLCVACCLIAIATVVTIPRRAGPDGV